MFLTVEPNGREPPIDFFNIASYKKHTQEIKLKTIVQNRTLEFSIGSTY
jgi:hypothetical protein